MKNQKQLNKISQFLCFVLRHKPEAIGIEIDTNGFTCVKTLIEKASMSPKTTITMDELHKIVDTDDKNRYLLVNDENGNLMIRTNQGHSLKHVCIEFTRFYPEKDMYHGTARRNHQSIMANGLEPRGRNFVHLTDNIETATSVGKRYDVEPIILVISKDAPLEFFITTNNVIQVGHVPPEYIKTL